MAGMCPFCSRAQPAQRVSSKAPRMSSVSAGRLAALVFVAAVSVVGWARGWMPATTGTISERPRSTVVVTSTRHPHGFEITNRETESLAECVIRIPEQWSAKIPALAAGDTATVTWAQFRNASGAEMSPVIGQNARTALFACDSHKETRRPVTLRFR